MAKIKRYFGKKYNVDSNLYFEEYMSAVSKDPKKVLAYKSDGLVSRSQAMRIFGLTKEDFEQDLLKDNAYVITVKGQTGLFFEEKFVKEAQDNKDPIPPEMIPEQIVKRSFRKKDLPDGFPAEYRCVSQHGRQVGRMGPPTYFYSEEVLETEFQVKVLKDGQDIIPVKKVPLDIQIEEGQFFGLIIKKGICTKMEKYYFGEVARRIRAEIEDL